jgi:endonuclease YncB( thermonuclease family)
VLSGLGRTPVQRAVLLVAGSFVAFLLGRFTAGKDAAVVVSGGKEIPPSVSGTPLVLDGDTIDINGVRVRLFGIDAPERGQLCERADGSRYDCGQKARESLLAAIDNGAVRCTRRDVDPYGRMVAVCSNRQGDLGAMLVEEGAALAYRHYSNDYVDEEAKAQAARRGLWQGRFEAPWDYRHNGSAKKAS